MSNAMCKHGVVREPFLHGNDCDKCAKESGEILRAAFTSQPTDTQRLDWWFAHGMEDSVCEGSVDLWWADDESETVRVTHGTSVRHTIDKAMQGISETDTAGASTETRE